jgi:hypothetical protein
MQVVGVKEDGMTKGGEVREDKAMEVEAGLAFGRGMEAGREGSRYGCSCPVVRAVPRICAFNIWRVKYRMARGSPLACTSKYLGGPPVSVPDFASAEVILLACCLEQQDWMEPAKWAVALTSKKTTLYSVVVD